MNDERRKVISRTAWEQLSPVDQYIAWRAVNQKEATRSLRAMRQERRHTRLMDYVDRLTLNALGAGITAVVISAAVAIAFLIAGHPVEGAATFGTVVTLASAFVTGRITRRRR